jgi:hypothetical protein
MKQNTKLIQLLMAAEEILVQSFRAIRERHTKQMSVFFIRKNPMEHIAFQQSHSAVPSILFRINGIHPV